MNITWSRVDLLVFCMLMLTGLAVQGQNGVDEWNLEAARLTVLPASALSPVQQTRVMAIVQVSVHDAVNGITGEYRPYRSHGAAPGAASAEAAAIAAAHHTLRNLFASQAASLDAKFLASLANCGNKFWVTMCNHDIRARHR